MKNAITDIALQALDLLIKGATIFLLWKWFMTPLIDIDLSYEAVLFGYVILKIVMSDKQGEFEKRPIMHASYIILTQTVIITASYLIYLFRLL